MGAPRISVAIPTVGRETLLHTLRSLERQTVSPHEVIVVNQGAPELEGQLSVDLPIVFIQQPVRGLSRARNAAFQKFTGDWIAFIDDDEEANAEWVEQMGLAIQAYRNVDFLGGVYFQPVGYKPEDGFCSELYALGEQPLTKATWLKSMGHPSLQRDAWGGNAAFSRRCFERIGLNDEWLGRGAPDFVSGEDTDYALRALTAGFEGLLSPRIIIYHTFGTRPHSLDPLREAAMLGAVEKWKSERDPDRIDPGLASRLHPFGRKKATVARLTAGRLFEHHQMMRDVYEGALELLNLEYELIEGRLSRRSLP